MKNYRLLSLLCACALLAGTVPAAAVNAEDAAEETQVSAASSAEATYSVSYTMGGGFGRIETTDPVEKGVYVPLSPWALRKDGLTHTGWTDGTNTYRRGEKIKMPDHDIVLEPVWTKIYTAKYENLEQYGYPSPFQDGTVSPGTEIYLPNLAMHNGDASFMGWLVNGELYEPLSSFTMPEEDVYVEVYWQYPRELKYYAGDVDGVLGTDNFITGKLAGLKLDLSGKERLARVGYKLTGWYEPVEDKIYDLEGRYLMPDRDVVMYAVWEPGKVAMEFSAGGGEGKMSDQIAVFDSYVQFSECTFTKEGYKLAGWKHGDDYYTPDSVVQAKVKELGVTMDFEAVWIEEDRNPGDINGDGKVDVADLTALGIHLIGDEEITDEELLANADTERDGEVNTADLAKLKQFIQKEKILLGVEG